MTTLTAAPLPFPHTPAPTRADERAARRSLLAQVERLESELAGVFTSEWPRRRHSQTATTRAPSGPRLLTIGQLERLRDDLADRLHDAREQIAERTGVEESHRVRIEAMLLEPERHRWTRVSNADIGEPGCKHWHVRPRFGILGTLMKWWRVRISSGCPDWSCGRASGPQPEAAQHQQRRLAQAPALGQQPELSGGVVEV